MAHKRRDLKKEAAWRRIIGRQARSGVTVRAWCLDRQLSEATFHWWRRELARRDGEPRKSARTGERKKSTRAGELKKSTSAQPREGGKKRTRPAAASPAFVPVRVAPDILQAVASDPDDLQAGGSPIEIVLPAGRCIRVRGPVDRQTLTDVLEVLTSASSSEAIIHAGSQSPRGVPSC